MADESFMNFVNQEMPKRISTSVNPLTVPLGFIWVTTGVGLASEPVDPATLGGLGQSAYEIAVANGFVGTESQWLESLNGTDGQSAYAIAVANGFVGTEIEWLESLKGKSAYETAVEQGFAGTEAEWNARLDVLINTASQTEGDVLEVGPTGPRWSSFNDLFHQQMINSGFSFDAGTGNYFIDQGNLPDPIIVD